MKESAYDRALIVLALLAPLLLFALDKWRASLDTWYAPLEAGNGDFGERFTRSVSDWLAGEGESGPRLIVIAERECPCTKAALLGLDAALERSSRKDIRLDIRYIDDPGPNDDPGPSDDAGPRHDPAWDAVLNELPATPTLLAIEGRQLVYAGPVNSGNLCTTAVQRVLGVTALEQPRATPIITSPIITSPIINWLDRGCYCRSGP